jgi:hypothetical protein
MSKKRIAIMFAIVVTALLGLVIAFSLHHSLDFQTFQNRLPAVIASLQLTQIEVHTLDPNVVSQPFPVRILAKLTGRASTVLATRETLTLIRLEQQNGKRVRISLQLSGENINRIGVSQDTNTESEAKTLHAALTKAFPEVSIDLKLNRDASSQKP